MSKKYIYTAFFILFFLLSGNGAFAYQTANWTGEAGDGDWWNFLNWDLCEEISIPEIPCVPDENTLVYIEPGPPGPNITGDPCCMTMDVHPWSWSGAPNTEVNIAQTTGIFNCGWKIGICAWNNFNSDTAGHGVINMYGGTVNILGDINGLKIGGGMWGTGNCYGILNIYGGLMTGPKIEINYGVVNLYGGILEDTSSDSANFFISDLHSMNKINVAGGTLRLNGDRRAEIDASSRIIPYQDRGYLVVDYNVSTIGYTTVTAISDTGIAWNPNPADKQSNVNAKPTLTWSPGDYVQYINEHQVYFGTSSADVNDATVNNPLGVYKGVRDVNNYFLPGPLDVNTKYYWRIDEVNDANANSPWKGRVWRFTTSPCPYGGSGLVGDFTEDCLVDLYDVKVLSQEWLTEGQFADIYPDIPDGIVDFGDFAMLAQNWLVEQF